MKNLFGILCLLLVIIFHSHAQDIPIGQWRIHLPYTDAMSVAEAKNRIYCATGKGLFFYYKTDNHVERLSKISGLSELELCSIDPATNQVVGGIKYNPNVDELLICYTNTNIDIIKGGKQIINLSDIYRKSIAGKKTINRITISGDYAYLSCSFGIEVLNMRTLEFKDTYHVGTGGTNREIFDVTSDDSCLYAATDSGLYKARLDDPIISYFAAWHYVDVNPLCVGASCPLMFSHLAFFGGKVLANAIFGSSDTCYSYDGTSWTPILTFLSSRRTDLAVSNNLLLICDEFGIYGFDQSMNKTKLIYKYSTQKAAYQAINDKDNIIWIADNGSALVRISEDERYEKIFPNGPYTNAVWAMDIQQNNLWVAPGGFNGQYAANFNYDGVFTFQNSTWATFNSKTYPAMTNKYHDFVNAAVNPTNPNQVYLGTWGSGLVEFDNNNYTAAYDSSNSTLKPSSISGDNGFFIGGLAFDTVGNLWVGNARSANMLSVKTINNKWYSYNIPSWNNEGTYYEMLNSIVDKNNSVWSILRNGHIGVFNNNNTFDITSDDQAKVLSTTLNQGHLPGSAHCMATDHDGAVWVGTDVGVAVFYSPADIFSNNNYDCQQILIEQDGHAQYLLGAESVTAIAVDGGNRKWFGTANGGVFLMSADGITQIYHFDETNSPLLSKSITSIKINQQTGEVFFGTDKGIVSFKGTSTEGNTDCNLFIYPNPVRNTYSGTIGIRGLVANMNVKITDITGTLVYETIAEGGQAIWKGTNFKGERPSTGVYMVLCTTDDGTQTCTGKLLFIN